MLLESFVIHKTLVDKVFLRTLKFEHVFCYSNLHQMFSNLLWGLIYFVRRTTCVLKKNAYVLDPFNITFIII
jgi:hypothetical protein